MTTGWNLVSLPFASTLPARASDLVESMGRQGIAVQHVSRWQNGGWQSYIPGFGPIDYSIELGRGYFVNIAASGPWRP